MTKKHTIEAKEMIELENWLKENENKTLSLSEYLEIFSKMTEEQRNYIIMAKIIPQNEIEEALEYYDGHRFPIQVDEIAFVIGLANKYSTDRITIIERIRQVRMINQLRKSTNNTKKRKKVTKTVV